MATQQEVERLAVVEANLQNLDKKVEDRFTKVKGHIIGNKKGNNMSERKEEIKVIEIDGEKVKVCRYEGTTTWQVCEEQES